MANVPHVTILLFVTLIAGAGASAKTLLEQADGKVQICHFEPETNSFSLQLVLVPRTAWLGSDSLLISAPDCCLAGQGLSCKHCNHMTADLASHECRCSRGYVLDPIKHACQHQGTRWALPLHTRSLKQQLSPPCPPGCQTTLEADGTQRCMLHGTADGYKCTRCQNALLVNLETGKCDCPRGYYAVQADTTCQPCLKGSYCPGGEYDGVAPPNTKPAMVDCPLKAEGMMTTRGARSTSQLACVNMPGYKYVKAGSGVDNKPSATACLADTYSTGLRKQQECMHCPPGYTTGINTNLFISRSVCVVKQGFYLQSPGVAAPCPKGEYKAGYASDTSCTKCADGVTTQAEASTHVKDCKVLLPSFYASAMTTIGTDLYISATKKCPQKYYCPGEQDTTTRNGVPSAAFVPLNAGSNVAENTLVFECPYGTYTEFFGATSSAACMTPPGYKTVVAGTEPTTVCGAGEYRPEWAVAAQASSCITCGEGIAAEATEQITMYAITDETSKTVRDVKGSAAGCYINAGQGMYYNAASKTYWATNCNNNNYGVNATTFGLQANPCHDCPAGMHTKADLLLTQSYRNPPGVTGTLVGFTDPLACVTDTAYGFDGRIASRCAAGSWNAGNNHLPCTPCGYGLSTQLASSDAVEEVAKQDEEADCKLDVGFGYHDNTIMPCPIGTYNDVLRNTRVAECTACPDDVTSGHLTTAQTGGRSAADCNMCKAGYGAASAAAVPCCVQCGGNSPATYGPAGRPAVNGLNAATCVACPLIEKGYFFDFGATRMYAPAVVSRPGAESTGDCLAEFAQIGDIAWYMGGTADMETVAVTGSLDEKFADCVNHCKTTSATTCQYVTFDYVTGVCMEKLTVSSPGSILAFKALLAADTAGSSVNKTSSPRNVTGHALSSGSYTMWWDAGDGVGAAREDVTNTLASPVKAEGCLNACSKKGVCAAAAMVVGAVTDLNKLDVAITKCTLIMGDSRHATGKRSVTRVIPDRLVTLADKPAGCSGAPPGANVDWATQCLQGTVRSGICTGTCKTGFIKTAVSGPTGDALTSTCDASDVYTTPTVTCAAGCAGTPSGANIDWTQPSSCPYGTLDTQTCTGSCQTGFIAVQNGSPVSASPSALCTAGSVYAAATPAVTCVEGCAGVPGADRGAHVVWQCTSGTKADATCIGSCETGYNANPTGSPSSHCNVNTYEASPVTCAAAP